MKLLIPPTFTVEPSPRAGSPLTGGLPPRLSAALSAAAEVLERHPKVALVLLLLLYLPAALAGSQTKPLWHDELFTYYIAQAPTLPAVWTDLRLLDLNPPFVYLATRLCFRLFGIYTLTTRLPEIIFFFVAMLGVFRFVMRRMQVTFAVFAAALLFFGKGFELALEARPYTLLLGCLTMAMVGWQQAAMSNSARSRKSGIALLAVSVAGMLLSHIFAVPALGALFAAESWRTRVEGRIDKPVFTALLLPCVLTLLYFPMLRNHGGAIYPEAFQPTGDHIFAFYIGAIERELVALLLSALLVLLLLGPAHLRSGRPVRPLTGETQSPPGWFFSSPEWVLLVGLLLLPLLLMSYLMATHGAFFPRYGAVATLAVVLLTAALFCRWTTFAGSLDPRAALIGLFVVLLISDHTYVAVNALSSGQVFHSFAGLEPKLPPCDACLRSAAAGTDGSPLPLVDASGLTFVEMNHNEDAATVSRLFYLTSKAASTQIAHASIFERMAELVAQFHLGGHVMEYREFVHTHPHFYVLGKYDWPEDWLLRKLIADGASVRVLGRTQDEYRDKELYEVNIPR